MSLSEFAAANLSKGIRVIHNRREKVDRLHDGKVVPHLINQRVVAGVKADNQLVIGKFG